MRSTSCCGNFSGSGEDEVLNEGDCDDLGVDTDDFGVDTDDCGVDCDDPGEDVDAWGVVG